MPLVIMIESGRVDNSTERQNDCTLSTSDRGTCDRGLCTCAVTMSLGKRKSAIVHNKRNYQTLVQ